MSLHLNTLKIHISIKIKEIFQKFKKIDFKMYIEECTLAMSQINLRKINLAKCILYRKISKSVVLVQGYEKIKIKCAKT